MNADSAADASPTATTWPAHVEESVRTRLEALPRYSPSASNRRDEAAESLAAPFDPRMIRDTIQESHGDKASANTAADA